MSTGSCCSQGLGYELLNVVRDDYLRALHGFVVVIQLGTGLALWFVTDRDAVVPLYAHWPGPRGNGTAWEEAPSQHLGSFPVGLLAPVFLWMNALQHALTLAFYSVYQSNLEKRQNWFRWLEYAFSASLMHVMVALLCGIFDIHLLFLIAALTAITMYFGHLEEQVHRGFLVGFLPWAAQWMVIACFFFRSIEHAEQRVPAFVYGIYFGELILDMVFPFAAQYFLHADKDTFLRGEYVFVVASFVAKQALAWTNWGGTRSL